MDTQHVPNLRWNFWIGVLNGVAFRVVDTLMNPSLVLVVFLAHLTDNPLLLGMAAPLWNGGWMLPQLLVTGRLRQTERMMPLYRASALGRCVAWMVLLVGMLFLRDPNALVVCLFFFLVSYPLVSGVGGLAFMEIVGRVIPPRLRGLYFSWRLGAGGVVALGASALVNRILDPAFPLDFPHNFTLLFIIALVFVIAGLVLFQAVREPAMPQRQAAPAGLRGQWGAIRRIWQDDAPYRRFILARVALQLAAGVVPLIVVYAQGRFGLPLSAAAVFLIADTAFGLIAVAASGWLSLRLGNRRLSLIAVALGVLALVMILVAGVIGVADGAVLPYFTGVFILLAVFNGATAISMTALNLNLSPEGERPLYLGLANTIFGIAFYLSAAQGALVSLIGYDGLFLLAAGLMTLGLWYTMRVHDPTEAVRSGR